MYSKQRKTSDNIKKIVRYLKSDDESKTKDIAEYLGLSAARARVILNSMDEVEVIGSNTNRKYRLKKDKKTSDKSKRRKPKRNLRERVGTFVKTGSFFQKQYRDLLSKILIFSYYENKISDGDV